MFLVEVEEVGGILGVPFEQMNRQVAIDVGKAIGDLVAIDWRDIDGGGLTILELGKRILKLELIVGSSVREAWVVGGDFNSIINDVEKEGAQRKSRATREEFKDVLEELSLIDIKTDKGWFTWVNNWNGNNMVKERLDRLLISANAIDNFPFLVTIVVRQTNLDHDAILMDTLRHKPRENFKDPRLFFKYDVCWAKEKEAKDIIKKAWNSNDTNIIEKLEKVRVELGT
ncbi:hypothetical protein GOBAR_DD08819 [Gossypium barbadense]|nr:hypothetical protein GOBAR_DD08819 [Gossypium barbadense]